MAVRKFSNRFLATLDFIVAYKTTHDGNSPTVRQIAQECGLSSTSVANWHLRRLEQAGYIKRPSVAGVTRSIEVAGGTWTPPANLEAEL